MRAKSQAKHPTPVIPAAPLPAVPLDARPANLALLDPIGGPAVHFQSR
jgi:hypothetical protein